MKVEISKNTERSIYLCQLEAAEEIVKQFEGEEQSASLEDAAKHAISIATGISSACFEVLKAKAEIMPNNRICNRYTDTSENLDVSLNIYAFDEYYGFYNIHCYLSDVWESTGDNSEELRKYMYIEKYERK